MIPVFQKLCKTWEIMNTHFCQAANVTEQVCKFYWNTRKEEIKWGKNFTQ